MRRESPWKSLITQLRAQPQFPQKLPRREIEIFLEIEAVLYLYETLCPQEEGRDAWQAWALVSGYFIQGINDQPAAQRQCLLLRESLRYVRTATAWRWWLTRYANQQPETVRLYKFISNDKQNGIKFRRKTYEVILGSERLPVYQRLFTEQAAEPEVYVTPFAQAGIYRFEVGGSPHEVEISEKMAEFANKERPTQLLDADRPRPAIEVTWNDLLASARELDDLENVGQFPERGNWYERLSNLRLVVPIESHAQENHCLSINDIFHLVGLLGIGKSSLIWVLTYHLVCKQTKHVTVIVSTVVESYRMAVWLRRLGIRAAPRLGRNRADHEKKYGLANAESLSTTHIFQPTPPDEPVLDWMPIPCALSGSQKESIPIGSEPCRRLIGVDGKRYMCPLLPVCPVHNVERDLVESQVWIVNPMSFLYSAAPSGVGEMPLRLLEAVYQLTDLIIIDEADRVQVMWDRALAETRPLVGSDDALLDRLRIALALQTSGKDRHKAAQASFYRLTKVADQVNILANRAFRLLRSTPRLAKWIKNYQITGVGILSRLAKELGDTATEPEQEATRSQLREKFREFWNKPLRRESGALADWLSALLGTDRQDKRLHEELEAWLAEQMEWPKPFIGIRQLFLRKLDFALTITALIKRTNDIYYQLKWLEDDLPVDDSGYELPDAVVNLVPDPPLGVLLGVRHVGQQFEGDLGLFNAVHYRGIGRWLMLNLPTIYQQQTGERGPHVLLTSATSWLPGAAQANIAVTPNAVLLKQNTAVNLIDIHFRPVHTKKGNWIKVSGTGKYRELHLRQIVRALAKSGPHTPSDFQKALDYWRDRNEPRRLLLVVSSYDQTDWVLDELNSVPEWKGRAARILPDDTEMLDEYTLRTREVERFKERDADILIAPLMAIQRGFNILDETEGALLGTAFFLVRPYPPPEDLTPQILSMNSWVLNQLEGNSRVLKDNYSSIRAMTEFRNKAYGAWNRRLASGRRGLGAMADDYYAEFLKDQFVLIWQTVGRLLRGGRGAHVYFVDGAFSAKEGKRNMLLDWHKMLDTLINLSDPKDQFLAESLYFSAWDAFHRAYENKEIF